MTRPSVTVCVVTYNQRHFIEQCLRSILEQHAEVELSILVGDDCSTDGTSEMVAALALDSAGVIQHHRHQANIGAHRNMCHLLSRAQGDFIARVDGDDYWLPGKLHRQIDYLANHPGCNAVYTNAITVDESGRRLGHFTDLAATRIHLPALLRRGNVLNNSSVLFRRNNLPTWVNSVNQLDYQVHLTQARLAPLGYIAQPLAAYRVNTQGSMLASSNAHVRQLYWQAIMSVPRDAVSDADLAHGLADFLRRVVFRALRTRDTAMLRQWSARVYAASPYGRLRTTALLVCNIARMTGKMLIAQLPFSRAEKNVLYRH